MPVADLAEWIRRGGWTIREVLAIAPVLGADAARIERVRSDAKAWGHLLSLEEEIGRRSDRWLEAAAVVMAAQRNSSEHTIN